MRDYPRLPAIGAKVTVDRGTASELKGTVVGHGYIESVPMVLMQLGRNDWITKEHTTISCMCVHPSNVTEDIDF